ncbi:MAG TPA: hypothetical protein DDX54_01615 [Rhodospirillaceae bacterium]|jgi:O-6-methylguanine DNA methyltransferase|nr:methylated-DNA--[protein]-cysteine S-methyltransferase [Alphaproteobacteria bacterium]HBH26087.1 hypothetical protein [Rhodospirillaceae bacterium]
MKGVCLRFFPQGGGALVYGEAGTELGPMAAGLALTGLAFLSFLPEARARAEKLLPGAIFRQDDAAVSGAIARAVDVWAGRAADGDPLPLSLHGTDFQWRVWCAMLAIQKGRTCTYGDLASVAGGSPIAVGQAVGSNPLALLVPCHRVLHKDPNTDAWAWGTERKRDLLHREEVL